MYFLSYGLSRTHFFIYCRCILLFRRLAIAKVGLVKCSNLKQKKKYSRLLPVRKTNTVYDNDNKTHVGISVCIYERMMDVIREKKKRAEMLNFARVKVYTQAKRRYFLLNSPINRSFCRLNSRFRP